MFALCRPRLHAVLRFVRRPLVLVLLTASAFVLCGAAYHFWPEIYYHRAAQALQRRDYGTARTELERYLASRPDSAHAHFLLAQLDRRGDRLAEADKHLAACRRLGGPADAIRLEHVLMEVQTGAFTAQHEDYCRRCLDQGDVDEYLVLEAFSQGFSKTYRLKEAMVCLQRMLEIQPDNGFALRRRAWIHKVQENFEAAESDYRQAIEIDPSDSAARLELAQLLLDIRKDGVEAAEHFERLWQERNDAVVAMGLARSWLAAGSTDEARRLLDDWLAGHPRDAVALTERGKLALLDRQPEQAETWLRRAVAIAPYALDANDALSRCLSQLGQTEQAEACQERIKQTRADAEQLPVLTRRLQQMPGDADLRCRIAQIFLRQGQPEEGERWLRSLLQEQPDYEPARQALKEHSRLQTEPRP
jgi:tetratricopeptide (TPR) repeat protein